MEENHYQQLNKTRKLAITELGIVIYYTSNYPWQVEFDMACEEENRTAREFYDKLKNEPSVLWVRLIVIHLGENEDEVEELYNSIRR